jgi:hypothetical protein
MIDGLPSGLGGERRRITTPSLSAGRHGDGSFRRCAPRKRWQVGVCISSVELPLLGEPRRGRELSVGCCPAGGVIVNALGPEGKWNGNRPGGGGVSSQRPTHGKGSIGKGPTSRRLTESGNRAMEARAALWAVRHFPSQNRIRHLNCPCLFNVQQQRLQHQTATYRTTNTRLEHIETAQLWHQGFTTGSY